MDLSMHARSSSPRAGSPAFDRRATAPVAPLPATQSQGRDPDAQAAAVHVRRVHPGGERNAEDAMARERARETHENILFIKAQLDQQLGLMHETRREIHADSEGWRRLAGQRLNTIYYLVEKLVEANQTINALVQTNRVLTDEIV